MRILHFSDVHIGVENYGRTDPDTGLSTRLTDFLETLDEVVGYAVDSRVDLALFCGDAYKSRDPSQTHQREFAKRVARLATAGVPVFLLSGNHDMPHIASRATALEIFRTLEVRNVYTGDTLDTHLIPTTSGPVQIVALPWIRRGNFLTRQDTQGLTPDEINEAIQARLSAAVRTRAAALDPAVPALFAGHVSVSEATTGSEQSMMLGSDHVLLKSDVGLPQFDYVALGHVHRHQVLGRDPLIVYSGSLQRVDFGEEKDTKGFCMIEIDPARSPGTRVTGFDFHEVAARSFVTISVDVPRGDLNPTATVLNAIAGQYIDGAIVRVIVTLPGELGGHLDHAAIRGALADAHFVASVSVEVQEEARVRLGRAYSSGLEPRVALRLYLESRGTPADRAEVLMRRAQVLMAEDGSG